MIDHLIAIAGGLALVAVVSFLAMWLRIRRLKRTFGTTEKEGK